MLSFLPTTKSINVIDATFGGGGYSKKILEKLNVNQLLAIDRDPISKIFSVEIEKEYSNFTLINDQFSRIENIVRNSKFKDKKFEQSIETLILNLETIISSSVDIDSSKLCKKIVFTSPTPSNGKSFLSRSFAQGLSGIGNKVLLIDADLKRGDQHKIFGKETIDLDFFSKLSLDSINSLKVENNLYFLPKLKRLKNTFEYFYGNLFLEKLKELEESFDYIIFDTAPALSVSDTGLLVSSSDFNFMIVRHQLSRINEIKQTHQVINQVGRSFDGVIYNGYKKPSGYYGYYDLYGDYSYRYYAERYLYDDYYEQNED